MARIPYIQYMYNILSTYRAVGLSSVVSFPTDQKSGAILSRPQTLAISSYTVRPMSHIHLTRLQKRNRAWWQMLFHPTALRSEFCNPLNFGQIHLSCAFCALPGWNMTQKIRLFLHHWSTPPSPSMQYFILIGWKSPVLPGPDIVFRPVHKKKFGQFHKKAVTTYTQTKG